mmetsp:Transcript_7396/g.18571  ORF Transcript_7396/g.18571 Transcript_7396/m.18571 type:complete len:206 (+) Transcript_7396:176-793(+)
MRLGPCGTSQGKLRLLASREAADIPVTTHLFVDAELLQMLDDLTSADDAFVHITAHGGQSQVTSARKALSAQLAQLIHRLECILLLVVHALPVDLVHQLPVLCCPGDDVPHLLAVLAMECSLFLPGTLFLLVLWVHQVALGFLIPTILEAKRQVSERRRLVPLPQRGHVVLGDERQSEVVVLPHLADRSLVFRRVQLAAQQPEER